MAVKEVEAPLPQYIQDNLVDLFRHYRERNDMYDEIMSHANGKNEIMKPKTAGYQVMTLHMWYVRSYLNERLARFLQIPHYRFIPSGISEPAQSEASYNEKCLNTLMYWARRGDDDFGKAVADVLLIDGGAMAWEANMQAAFPRLTNVDEQGDDDITRGMPTGLRGEQDGDDDLSDDVIAKRVEHANRDRVSAREKYKRAQGEEGVKKLFTHRNVPYNAFFPFPDSSPHEEVIEIEFRSVRKVISNKLFDKAVTGKLRARTEKDGQTTFRDQVPIIRYCNQNVYAYYLAPDDVMRGQDDGEGGLLNRFIKQEQVSGVELLYAYEHNAGRPLYTHYRGMHGGWGAGDNAEVKGKIRAMMDISTAIDELCSQAFSNVRETFWPTLLFNLDVDRPEQPLNDSDAKKLTHRGTADMYLFKGEEAKPMFQPRDNPIFNNLMERLTEAMAKIGGAPGLYGIHQSGVEGGFQENTLLQQADSQFARVENNIATSAQDDALVLLALVRAMGEKIPIRVKTRGRSRQYTEDLVLDPKTLDPMPMIDADVRLKNPGDMAVAIRNFLNATTDTAGPGTAAMARDKGRETFLGDEQPDDTDAMLKIQTVTDATWLEIVQPLVMKRFGLKTAKQALAEAPVLDMSGLPMDPDLAAQAAMFGSGQMPTDPMAMPPTGMPPVDPMAPPMTPIPTGPNMQGQGGGTPLGVGQPEAAAGRSLELAMMG